MDSRFRGNDGIGAFRTGSIAGTMHMKDICVSTGGVRRGRLTPQFSLSFGKENFPDLAGRPYYLEFNHTLNRVKI